MSEFKTEQEAFWAGDFGTDYISRNREDSLFASNLHLFGKALSHCRGLDTAIEFGANIGLNLKALKILFPGIEVSAVEINSAAVEGLKEFVPIKNIHHGSILEFKPGSGSWDLAFVKGVLIHINPDDLPAVYETIFEASSRYILVAEYFNPSPVAIPYRGHQDRLFKRDFAGEMLDRFDNLVLLDYGFAYRRDPLFPQDDITWFLLEKV